MRGRHISALDELAYVLPREAIPGQLYPTSIRAIAAGLGLHRTSVAVSLRDLCAMGIVLNEGRRWGIQEPGQLVDEQADAYRNLEGTSLQTSGGHLPRTIEGTTLRRRRARPSTLRDRYEEAAPERVHRSGDGAASSFRGKTEPQSSLASAEDPWRPSAPDRQDRARTAALVGQRWLNDEGQWRPASEHPAVKAGVAISRDEESSADVPIELDETDIGPEEALRSAKVMPGE